MLEGGLAGSDQSVFVENVIDVIAKNLPTEIVPREVLLLGDIHSDSRKHDETPAFFPTDSVL